MNIADPDRSLGPSWTPRCPREDRGIGRGDLSAPRVSTLTVPEGALLGHGIFSGLPQRRYFPEKVLVWNSKRFSEPLLVSGDEPLVATLWIPDIPTWLVPSQFPVPGAACVGLASCLSSVHFSGSEDRGVRVTQLVWCQHPGRGA